MGRKKKTPEPEEDDVILAEGADVEKEFVGVGKSCKGDPPPHHWSDDGPRYTLWLETPESVEGTRIYKGFFETEDLSFAKTQCLNKFQKEGRTTYIWDRADRLEVIRHEAGKEVKDDSATTESTPAPRRRRKSE